MGEVEASKALPVIMVLFVPVVRWLGLVGVDMIRGVGMCWVRGRSMVRAAAGCCGLLTWVTLLPCSWAPFCLPRL